MDENDVILNIEIRYEDAVKGIAEFQQKIEETKNIQEGLKKALAEGVITKEAYSQSMAAAKVSVDSYKKSIQTLEKEARTNLKIEKEQTGSINNLRAQLSATTAAYNAMSEAERNAYEGQESLRIISELTAKLKELEEEHGDYRRSVGDYEQATRSLRAELREYVAQLARMKLEGKEVHREFLVHPFTYKKNENVYEMKMTGTNNSHHILKKFRMLINELFGFEYQFLLLLYSLVLYIFFSDILLTKTQPPRWRQFFAQTLFVGFFKLLFGRLRGRQPQVSNHDNIYRYYCQTYYFSYQN
jgi:chromosome segregation ATPase